MANYKCSGLLGDLETLIAVQKAIEESREKTTRTSNSRDSRAAMDFDGPSDSPGPSPAENKQVRKYASQARTNSQPPKEKDSVKEDPINTGKTKITFALGEEVAFKPKVAGQTEERDWIQGMVVKVIGEGKSRRYDVQDPYPDDPSKPGPVYRSSASSMVPIPRDGTPLPDYELEKRVLALYPGSSTFYRATVKPDPETSEGGVPTKGGAKVHLLFDDEISELLKAVPRRFVLDHKG